MSDRFAELYEEIAKAILKQRYYDGEEMFYDGLIGFYRDIDPDHWIEAHAEARAVADRLTDIGVLKEAL